MGAFFISPHQYISDKLYNLFTKKGFGKPILLKVNNLSILIYKKQLLEELSFKRIDENFIFTSGTCFYKGLLFSSKLDTIFREFVSSSLDTSQFSGSFFLFIHYNNENFFLTDRAGVQNVFFSSESGIISSSFLATIVARAADSKKQKINKNSFYEVLTTGNLIGPDTLVNGIERYEPNIHKQLPSIQRIKNNTFHLDVVKNNSRSQEVGKQIDVLNNYFERINNEIEHFGAVSGLTGGFDSRLLYLVLRKHSKNYKLYSTFRERIGEEFKCASSFAEAAGESLLVIPHKSPQKTDRDELLSTLIDNLYFNDGQIRTHQLWIEEIKSKEYLKDIYGTFRIGFSGVGGEQYRNNDYYIKDKYPFKSWIQNDLVNRYSGCPFLNTKVKGEFILYLKTKISNLLNVDAENKFIAKSDIKRYYNEIYNPANRTVRNNIENQLAYFLSPFTEYFVAQAAYSCIPYLHYGHRFEMDMIARLAPELANLKTDYGFSINEKVSFSLRIVPYLKLFLGLTVFNSIYFFLKKRKKPLLKPLLLSHPDLSKYIEKNKSLDLALNFKELEQNNFLSPLLIETGLFLSEMDNYLTYD